MTELDYYKVLGVPSSADAKLIRKRYQQLAKQHHPDHQGDESSMVIINRAYEVLSSSSKRLEYDRRRSLSYKRQSPAYNTWQGTQARRTQPSYRAETKIKDKIVLAIFMVLLLITLFDAH